MTLKPKTVRRLLLLGIVAGLTLATTLGVLVVRHWQGERLSARLREEGVGASERGDHARAVDRLGRYLRRRSDQPEPDALLLYARSRSRLEERDNSHLGDAIGAYRRYLMMRPDDRAAELELLRLYNAARRYADARETARRLRPAELAACSEADLPVLREEVRALVAEADADPQLGPVAARICDLRPLELDAALTHCDWLAGHEQPEKARATADAVLAANPQDPRARLLHLLVGMGPPTQAEVSRVIEAVCEIAGLDPDDPFALPSGDLPDEAYVLRIAALLDQVRCHDHAVSVLSGGARREAMPGVLRLAVRRLWQSGRFDEVVAVTDGYDAEDPAIPSDLLAFRALAVRERNGAEDAALRTALESRTADFRAVAWAIMLNAPAPGEATPRRLLDERARAVAENPHEPVLRYLHAEALVAVGRFEDAIAEWRLAAGSPLAIGWAQPWLRISQACLELGLVRESIDAADHASRIAPRSASAALARFGARIARLERSPASTGDEHDLLRFAEAAEKEAFRMQDREAGAMLRRSLLPGRALILSRIGRSDEAVALIDRAAAESLPRDSLERLALISVHERLGREDALLAECVRLHGDAPTTAAVRAAALQAQGRTDDALAMLDQCLDRAVAGEDASWQVTRAAFLEQIGDSRATEAWTAAADQHPEDAAVQRAALRSPAASRDPVFVERVARRLADLTGDEEMGSNAVRLALARAMLFGQPTGRTRDRAISLLRAIISEQPSPVEARVMLADALLLEGDGRPDFAAARAELLKAAAEATDAAPLRIRVAEVFQREHDFAAARQELLLVARTYPEDLETQRRVAALLHSQGAFEDVVPIREALARASGGTPDRLALAEAYALVRRDADALAEFRALADSTDRTPDDTLALAVWLHRLADPESAARVVQTLESLPLDARDLYLARYDDATGNAAAAIPRLQAMVLRNPRESGAHVMLIRLLALEGRLEDAAAAAQFARLALPDEPRLAALEAQVHASADSEGLAVFADTIATTASVASADAVRAVGQAIRDGNTESAEGLTRLADRFPRELPVQNLVASRLLELQPSRPEEAARIAERAMAAFPGAPEPARIASAAYARLQRWDRAAACADAWRRRDPQRPISADTTLAQFHLMAGAAERALAVLQPRIGLAKADPTAPDAVAVLGLAASALVAQGQHEEAFKLLEDVLPASVPLRLEVLLPLALSLELPGVARQWLERAAAAFQERDVGERAALADAYARLALRSDPPDTVLLSMAEEIMAARGTSTEDPAILRAMGAICEARAEYKEAAAYYGRALSGAPSADLLGRLALLMPRTDAAAILTAAEAAVGSTRDPILLLPLAGMYQSVADLEPGPAAGPALRRALELLRLVLDVTPGSAEAILRSAVALEGLGDMPAAIDAYHRAASLQAITPELRATAQNNAAYLLLRHSRGPDDARRARSLAQSALGFERRAPFLDTAARAELALGDSRRAADLFREAINVAPHHVEARLGLATVLVEQGNAADAAGILEDLGDLVAKRSVLLSSDQARIWEDLRTRVKSGG